MCHALEIKLVFIAVTACNIWVVIENPKIITTNRAHLLRVNDIPKLFRVETTTCRELKQQTFMRSRTPTGSHSRQCECTPHVSTSNARSPLLRFKKEREILVLESSCLGKNYLVISDIVVKLLA